MAIRHARLCCLLEHTLVRMQYRTWSVLVSVSPRTRRSPHVYWCMLMWWRHIFRSSLRRKRLKMLGALRRWACDVRGGLTSNFVNVFRRWVGVRYSYTTSRAILIGLHTSSASMSMPALLELCVCAQFSKCLQLSRCLDTQTGQLSVSSWFVWCHHFLHLCNEFLVCYSFLIDLQVISWRQLFQSWRHFFCQIDVAYCNGSVVHCVVRWSSSVKRHRTRVAYAR